jgi:hypothetical protein
MSAAIKRVDANFIGSLSAAAAHAAPSGLDVAWPC